TAIVQPRADHRRPRLRNRVAACQITNGVAVPNVKNGKSAQTIERRRARLARDASTRGPATSLRGTTAMCELTSSSASGTDCSIFERKESQLSVGLSCLPIGQMDHRAVRLPGFYSAPRPAYLGTPRHGPRLTI